MALRAGATLMLEGGAYIRYIQALPTPANTCHRSARHPSLPARGAGDDDAAEQVFLFSELEQDQENRAGDFGLSATYEDVPDTPEAIPKDPS
ncbi:MAG: hypothetical protein ACYCV5_05745 [Acidimicrobiales bacterium]